MSLPLHPALRALGLTLGGSLLLVGGTLAAYTGLRAVAQATAAAPPAPVVATTPAAQNYIANPATGRNRVGLLVAQSHGDWSRLSTADQAMLNSMTAGHGHEMFRDLVKQYNARNRSGHDARRVKS